MGNEAGAAAAEGTEPQDPTVNAQPQNTGSEEDNTQSSGNNGGNGGSGQMPGNWDNWQDFYNYFFGNRG